jgi:hypothetical protein
LWLHISAFLGHLQAAQVLRLKQNYKVILNQWGAFP